MKRRWQLTPLKLFLILAALGILLILIAFLQIRELSNFLTDNENEQQFFTIERQWEEPTWTMANVFRPMHSNATPVIVVDEHFEVLKYWFDAVTAKVIPRTGNTLLHIDGHPDNAIPRDLAKIPWFHLPHNHSEVGNMMQSNDVFIAAAAATGLISRYIWVWPDWDKGEDHQTDHEISDVYAGWREYYPPDAKPFQRLCICVCNHSIGQSSDDDVENTWECYDDEPLLATGGNGRIEKGSQCQKVVSAVMEIVHEQKALMLLKEGGWIKPDESILLDIDEDFYGCESSFTPLLETGLTKDNTEQVSALLQGLLCVKDVKQELTADRILHTLIEIVADFKTQLCSKSFYIFPSREKSCLSEFEADKALIDLITDIKESLIKADAEDLLCSIDSSELVLQGLLRQLFSFTVPQLKSLQYVGACLVTAPTSLQFSPGSLHVCHGFNVPGDSVVKFHVPSEEENKERTALLKNILSHLPWQPFLVTVSRSMRDGYTPWRFFRYIETAVLSVLQAVFPNVTEKSFYFDENLLGGKGGWPQRRGGP